MSDIRFLEKFYPGGSIFQHFQVAEGLSEEETAFATWRALVFAKRNHVGLFLVIGKLLRDIRDNEMFLKLDYPSFNQFISSEELGFSRESAYMYMRTYEYYIEELDLDPEQVSQMNLSRLSMLVPVLKKMEDRQEILEKINEMQRLGHGDFVREIKKGSSKSGKPSVYWSEESEKWVVQFYDDVTTFKSLGFLSDAQDTE